MSTLRFGMAISSCLLLVACAMTRAQDTPGAPSFPTQRASIDPYAPFAFLIGEWQTTGSGVGPLVAVQRFRWGTGNSYIWYSTTNLDANGREHVHFEGMFLYNASTGNMDFLVVLEPGSLNQEQGTLHVEPDGAIVREIDLIGADGGIRHFRQTFRRTGDDTAVTTLMRQRADGTWEPNFPGSDNLLMTRRRGAAERL